MGSDELKLPNAVRPDDALDLEGTVLEERESKSKPVGESFATKSTCITNETVLQCMSSVLVARRSDAQAST
jgi:acyl dehydratase